MNGWSLPGLLAWLHRDIERRLELIRENLAHPGTKGDASEAVWLGMLEAYLPRRYSAASAFVVDSKGAFSEQIDVVIFDRQYTPPIFRCEGKTIIPAESVYAVFEAKQEINAEEVEYARKKVASVRRLHRTSLPIPNAGPTYTPKPPPRILGGLLALESTWSPKLGGPLLEALQRATEEDRLDFGCVAAHGLFSCDGAGRGTLDPRPKAATAFLLELIARLQAHATVPMIDVRAYGAWLTK